MLRTLAAALMIASFAVHGFQPTSRTSTHASTATVAGPMQSIRIENHSSRQNIMKRSLFNGLFGGNSGNSDDASAPSGSPSEVIIDLPAKIVKTGPLRFFLQIYLVGEQNKPVKESWFLQNAEDGCLDMYYKDGTGMFSIKLDDDAATGIQIIRSGKAPSLEYRLQESVMLHGVLDELYQIAYKVEDIDVEKRLLQFDDHAEGDDGGSKPTNSIDAARSALP
eukprot:CAMPEP_0198118600 /NCGR_PEP_ID=MMETSP1442-20131203/22388_1 /TAXON_ID= /ORGANISM="Craspedostauros australis, Strain CCMP3328" /LENGTH=221 /DNA_ID=CAMNT_0043776891 /DNA_START=193 /DNA_END=855 /DNA_ORIENTATION=+